MNRLGTLTAREAQIKEADPKYWILMRFHTRQVEDNWIHVRKLIQAMRIVEGAEEGLVELGELEKDLLLVLAVCQAGVTDVLPWLVVLDTLLRDTWYATLARLEDVHGKSCRPLGHRPKLTSGTP